MPIASGLELVVLCELLSSSAARSAASPSSSSSLRLGSSTEDTVSWTEWLSETSSQGLRFNVDLVLRRSVLTLKLWKC